MKACYVYVMTNQSRVVLYTGVTKSQSAGYDFMAIHRRKALQSGITLIDWSITKDSIILTTLPRARKRSKVDGGKRKNDRVQTLNPKWEDLGEKLFGYGRRGPSLRSE
jgi:hypothetical protein